MFRCNVEFGDAFAGGSAAKAPLWRVPGFSTSYAVVSALVFSLSFVGDDTMVLAMPFVRGDANVDGTVDISDARATLGELFLGDFVLPCKNAGDSNDDEVIDVSDVVNTLGVLFLGTGEILPPEICGDDPTPSRLGCESFVGCAPEPTAFRISEMYLRDPHVFLPFLTSCSDVTDSGLLGSSSINESLNESIVTDADEPPDGLLDLSLLLVFRPLDQQAAMGSLDVADANCAAPVAFTSCDAESGVVALTRYDNLSSGTCLGALPSTTSGYTPGFQSIEAPCWRSSPFVFSIPLAGVRVPLSDVQFAAEYDGDPVTSFTTGLIRGFLSETVANSTLIPVSLPFVGGAPISVVLSGGDGNCLADDPGGNCPASLQGDMDCNGSERGWWLYFEYVAESVTYTGP